MQPLAVVEDCALPRALAPGPPAPPTNRPHPVNFVGTDKTSARVAAAWRCASPGANQSQTNRLEPILAAPGPTRLDFATA
jgi:hypothetical protein